MRNCQNKREKSPNTRFNADIAFGMEIAYDTMPLKRLRFFLCNFHAKPYTGTAMQVKRMLNGRYASVQRAAEHPPVVRRTAPSNMRIKLTAKLKSLTAFSLLAAYPPPVRYTPSAGEEIY